MKFFKDLYNETLGELIEEMKETLEDIKSDFLQPFSEIVDEFKGLARSSRYEDDDEEDFEDYEDSDCGSSISSNWNPAKHVETSAVKRNATVTIKGVYQLNGPKPFMRVIECPQSETGYYSQLMGSKSRQAQWIQANYPGANVNKGFSMSINIK